MTPTFKKSAITLAALALVSISVLPANAAAKATTKPAPKPAVTGAPRAGGFGGGQNSAAFAKYTACLAKAGIKFSGFGGGRGFGAPGTRPTGAPQNGTGTTPRPRPTFSMSPTQAKAFAACAALRPSFGGFNRGAGANGGTGQGTNPGSTGGAAPKTGTRAAYLACLKAHGLPVTSAAQIAGLDKQNSKILAALKACVGK